MAFHRIFLFCIFTLSFCLISSVAFINATVCPEQSFRSTDFGIFKFEETIATVEGELIRVVCPYGHVENGLQPLSDLTMNSRKTPIRTQELESGAFGYCRLISINNITVPQWVFPNGMLEVKNCRTTGSANGVMKARKSLEVPVITPQNYKQLLGDINFLAFYAKEDYEVARIFVEGIGRLLSSAEIFAEQKSISGDLFNLLDSFTENVHVIPGYKITVESPHITVQTAQFPYNANSSTPLPNYSTKIDNVLLSFPSEMIQMGLEQNLSEPKLRITAYSEDVLFHWEEPGESSTRTITIGTTTSKPPSTSKSTSPSLSHSTTSSPTTQRTTTEQTSPPTTTESPRTSLGNWRVFSIELLDAVVQNLSREFEFTYSTTPEEIKDNNWTCVFYNETEKSWSTEGMESMVVDDKVLCKSNHFTAFSVLIDPLPLPIPGSDYAPIQNSVHSNVLSIISSIGSAISIVGLAGVILTYGLFRILLNLSVALLLMHIFSISSSKDLWAGYCLIPAMCLQYFLHSSLFWMLMEAHHMHQLLISVFVKPESKFIFKRSLVAWGIPLLIVGICAAIKPEVYSTGRYDTCIFAAHLSLPLYYIAYMGPVILILTINFGVFCRIFNVLYKQTSKQGKQIGKTKVKVGKNEIPNLNKNVAQNLKKKKYVMLSPTQIKGSLTVMLLVGVGWVVGLFAIGPFEVFFKYLFCLTNAGQGALIFLFRVILHPQACREWRKTLFGLNLETSEFSTTSSTNINTTNRKTKTSFSGSPAFISASNSVENSLTPSNPDAKDLAITLASMLRESEGIKDPFSTQHF